MKRQQYFYFLVNNKLQKYHHCATGQISYTLHGLTLDPHGTPAYYAATEDGTPITYMSSYNFPSQQHYETYTLSGWRRMTRHNNMQTKKKLLMAATCCIVPTNCVLTTSTWKQRYKFEVSVTDNNSTYPLRIGLTKPQAIQLAVDLNKQIKEIWK